MISAAGTETRPELLPGLVVMVVVGAILQSLVSHLVLVGIVLAYTVALIAFSEVRLRQRRREEAEAASAD